MKKIEDQDIRLIETAKEAIRKNHQLLDGRHTVGAAVRCSSGEIYIGINIQSNHGYCAEIIAIGSALASGERDFECITAIDYEGNILSPCGQCRQILFEYAPKCDVIFAEGENVAKMVISSLLPFPYERKNLFLKLRSQYKSNLLDGVDDERKK